MSRAWSVHGGINIITELILYLVWTLLFLPCSSLTIEQFFSRGVLSGGRGLGVVQSHGGLDWKWQYSGYVSERRYHRSVVLSGAVRKNYVECFGFARAWILYPSQVTTWWLEAGGVVVSKSEDFFLPIACSAWLLSSATLDFFGPNLSHCLASF